MPHYATELAASVIDQYLHTDKPVALIAREHDIDERDVTRIRHAAGVPPRRARWRSLPTAMVGLVEARALLRTAAVGRNKRGDPSSPRLRRARSQSAEALAKAEAERIAPDEAKRIAPGDAGGAMRCAYCALREGEERSAPAIDRIERLVEQELAAEEASRAKLGLLPRAPSEAERCARTLAILTRTLHALARLRGGATEPGSRHDDDIPADIDEFRRDLARRIEAFLASRPDEGNADGNPEPAPLDEAR